MIFHCCTKSYSKHFSSPVSQEQLPLSSDLSECWVDEREKRSKTFVECDCSSSSSRNRNVDTASVPKEGILRLPDQDQYQGRITASATVASSFHPAGSNVDIHTSKPFLTCSIERDNSLGLDFFGGEAPYYHYQGRQRQGLDLDYSRSPDTSYDLGLDRPLEIDGLDTLTTTVRVHSIDSHVCGNTHGITGNQNQKQQEQRHQQLHSFNSYNSSTSTSYASASTSRINLPPIRYILDPQGHDLQVQRQRRKKKYRRIVNILDRMTVALEVRKSGDGIGGSGLVQKEGEKEVDIWSKEYNIINEMAVPPPPIPARSRLRSVPSKQLLEDHDRTSIDGPPSNMKIITHRQSNLSLFKLPVDPPLTPTPISPTSSTSIKESPSSDGAFGFGKRKGAKAVERDPLKVRDGLQAKESTSGVYTPSTFPGAQGPRPSHFPTHVYTPTNFSLYPQTGYPVSPSGSSSSSQSDSTAPPKTPLSPTGRLSKAVSSNMRRLSSGIVSLKDRTYYGSTTPTTHQRSVTTPMLESGEYNDRFPTSDSYETNYGGASHSRESSSSWASWSSAPRLPPSTGSSYFPPVSSPVSGLGMDIDTTNNKTVVIDSSMDPDSVNFAVPAEPRSPALGLGPGSGSLAGKGKRKPVPRLGGEEVQVHAM